MKKKHKQNPPKFFSLLENNQDITALLTTRHYGFSQTPFASLNFSFIVGDDNKSVKQNYNVLANYLQCSTEDIFSMEQIHSNNVFILDQTSKKNISSQQIKQTDAVITNLKNTAILAMGADCPQIALYDPEKKVIAVIHAGWKGLTGKIIEKTLTSMQRLYQCRNENIIAHTGAHLCQKCFEVKKEVADIFVSNFENSDNIIYTDEKGKITVSLQNAILETLKKQQLKQKNISFLNMCTVCENDMFFSYRKENQKTGRTALALILR